MTPAEPNAAARAPVILVIDDEDYVADMIAGALSMDGYTTHVAYNGREGLERARALHCDLVVIDIMMPYISGLELVEQMRSSDHLRTVPVILISAGARPRQAQPNLVFLAKPFDMEHMLMLVADQLKAAGGSA